VAVSSRRSGRETDDSFLSSAVGEDFLNIMVLNSARIQLYLQYHSVTVRFRQIPYSDYGTVAYRQTDTVSALLCAPYIGTR